MTPDTVRIDSVEHRQNTLETVQANMADSLSEIKESLKALLQLASDMRLMQERHLQFNEALNRLFKAIEDDKSDLSGFRERYLSDRDQLRELISTIRESNKLDRDKDREVFLAKLSEASSAFADHKTSVQETVAAAKGAIRVFGIVWSVVGAVIVAMGTWVGSSIMEQNRSRADSDKRIALIEMKLDQVSKTVDRGTK